MSIRIILAEDHGIIREGIFSMFEKKEEFTVIAMAKNGREAVRLVRTHNPDIVIMDVSMPELNGIDATQIIKSEFPSVGIIALSAHSEITFITHMLRAGARGYVLKDCAFEDLSNAVQAVHRGEIFLGKRVSGVVVQDYISTLSDENQDRTKNLTAREREVLQLIAEGYKTKHIASELNVSVKTVETHRQHIMKKLELYNIADLTRIAIKEGLTSLDFFNKKNNPE